MGRFAARTLLLVAGALSLPAAAQTQQVTVTAMGVYRYTGAAPSPTPNFTLSFTIDRSPLICGGSQGAFLACGASKPRYTNGLLDVVLSQGDNPTAIFRDAVEGGGFLLFQQDLGLNRLGFTLGSNQLFSGTLSNPTLIDGVYALTTNPPCDQSGCHYSAFAGQSFASGDPINNPFFDPVSLQSWNPIESGSITIAAVVLTPEPASFVLMMTALVALALTARRINADHAQS